MGSFQNEIQIVEKLKTNKTNNVKLKNQIDTVL